MKVKVMDDIEKIEYLVENDVLKKHKITGNQFQCLCPFHSETNSSFGINLKTGQFNCFSGKCGVKGPNFEVFFKKIEEVYEIKFDNEHVNELQLINKKIQNIQILNNEQGEIKYMNESVLKNYNDPLGDYIYKRIPDENIIKMFEIRYRKSDNKYCIPIRHYNKRFYGFVVRQFIEPKYKYPYGFLKSKTLFGIDKVKGDVGIITEGQFDVINSYLNGYKDVVGLMGSDMSEEQEKLILKYFNKIIIATDNDDAGLTCMKDIYKRLKNKIKVKRIKWITRKKDLGELTKEELDEEINNAF
jgi:DNA primase